MGPVLTIRPLPWSHGRVKAIAYNKGLLFVLTDHGGRRTPEIIACWSPAGWVPGPGRAAQWMDWVDEELLTDHLLRTYARLLAGTAVPPLQHALAALGPIREAEEFLRLVGVASAVARVEADGEPPELIQTVQGLAKGWTRTGDELVDAAKLLLKVDGTPGAT